MSTEEITTVAFTHKIQWTEIYFSISSSETCVIREITFWYMQGVLNVRAILSVQCLFKLHGPNNIHIFSRIQKNLVVAKSDTLIVGVTQL